MNIIVVFNFNIKDWIVYGFKCFVIIECKYYFEF